MTSTDDASIVDQAVLETIATELRDVGWAVIDRAIPAPIIAALRDDLLRLDDGAFKSPGVGRGDDWQRSDDVRRDRVHWLDPDSEASQWYFRWVDSLRVGLNRRLMLGLFDYHDRGLGHVDADFDDGRRNE